MSVPDFDLGSCKIIERVICQARVCRCNPKASAAELMDAADQITRAASLMNEINEMGLTMETELMMKEAE